MLHGTGEPDIALFEPRQPEDLSEFGGRRAVFAAMDGIWPMYFAILDRVTRAAADPDGFPWADELDA